MNKFKFYVNLIKILDNSKLNIYLYLYIMFGIIMYLLEYRGISYINYIYIGLGHPYILSFFLIPTIFIKNIFLIRKFINNKNFILKFKSRSDFTRFKYRLLVLNTTKIFLTFLLILILCSNLFSNGELSITPDPIYNEINNLIGMITMVIKVYLLLFTCVSSVIVLIDLLNSKIFTSIVLSIILSFIEFIELGRFDFIFPAHYIGFSYIFNSYKENITFSTLYFIIINIILAIIMIRKKLKMDVM